MLLIYLTIYRKVLTTYTLFGIMYGQLENTSQLFITQIVGSPILDFQHKRERHRQSANNNTTQTGRPQDGRAAEGTKARA
jgi:hypothetical protein